MAFSLFSYDKYSSMMYHSQQLKQQTKILPHQIQLLHLFHLNNMELEHRIQQEMNDNPMLEQQEGEYDAQQEDNSNTNQEDFRDYDEFVYDDVPDYKLEYGNYFSEESVPERPIVETVCFREEIRQQFRWSNSDHLDIIIADYIIDCLDENGFLAMDLQALADDFSFRQGHPIDADRIEKVLVNLRNLEPGGLGSYDTRAFLIYQLNNLNKKRPDVKIALVLLEHYYQDLMNRQLDKLMHKLNLEEDEFRIVLELIAQQKMKPIAEQDASAARQLIVPDYIITLEFEKPVVTLSKERSAGLYISNDWQQQVGAMQQSKQKDKSAIQYVRNKLNAARWFIQAIRQREQTMRRIMEAIVHWQEEYFKEGDIRLLKPMILKNIAEVVEMDISTVSRITCNKYAETHFGTILLKDLFTEGLLTAKGEVVSNKVIQSAIVEVIEKEDKTKPYTDQQLVTILAKQGYNIARRTIAKYRDLLQIPVAQMRCLWA